MNKPNLFNQTTLSKKDFLKNYWHKKPLLFKEAFTQKQLENLPSKQKLVSLSCNQDIQSRIVIKNSETDYEIEIGPFEKEDFQNINNLTWNLLVSDIDKWYPKSREILDCFDFIRNWIFDDIMISTGSVGGTVGAHTDHYDVFLIQVAGQRQWQFGHNKIYNPKLLADVELKLLNKFVADESYLLNPGDVLYLPPEIAHYGIIKSADCVTCSIGMRTPSHSEILTDFIDNIAQNISADKRFEEPQFEQQPKIGEITQQDIENVKKILIENFNADNISDWFGKYLSSYRNIFHEFSELNETCDLTQQQGFSLNPFSKACYFIKKQQSSLFINGDQYNCSTKLAQLICDKKQLSKHEVNTLSKSDAQILIKLYQSGAIV